MFDDACELPLGLDYCQTGLDFTLVVDSEVIENC